MSPHKMCLHVANRQQVWYMDPDPWTLPVKEAIQACSRACRYANQTERHYSVLEHSLLVADILQAWGCRDNVIVQGLAHDLPEGFTGDIPAPIAHHPDAQFLRDINEKLIEAFCIRFGIPYPLADAVHEADRAAFRLEVEQGERDGVIQCHPDMIEWYSECPDVSGLGLKILWLEPYLAKLLFSQRLAEMYGQDGFLEIIRGKAVSA